MKSTITLYGFRARDEGGLMRLIADLICLRTGSPYFHVGVAVDHTYYEARPGSGVVRDYVVPCGAIKIRSWRADRDKGVEQWLRLQVGKPYDWPGIFGFVFGPSKQGRADRGKWFCSELATVALRKFGIEVCEREMAIHEFGVRWVKTPAWDVAPTPLCKDMGRA